MPLTTETKILALKDVKISPQISDPSGGSATYGAGVDIPGVLELQFTPKFKSSELRGDGRLLDIWSQIESAEFSFQHGKVSLNALAILMGGNVTLSGSTPNQVQRYRATGADAAQYFKLEGQAVYTDVGDTHVVLYKCKVNGDGPSFTMNDSEFATVQASGICIPRMSDDVLYDLLLNETPTDIQVTADTTAPTVSSTTPIDGATAVARTSAISWVFSEAIKLSCITAANFLVIQTDTGLAVAGTLSYNAVTNTVTFTPSAQLAATTVHNAIVTTAVEDLVGNHLQNTHVINFTTAA